MEITWATVLTCNEVIGFLYQLSGGGGGIIDPGSMTRVNTPTVGAVGWASVIDGRMCFPTDNVS